MSPHTACITHLIYFSKKLHTATNIYKHSLQGSSSFLSPFLPIIPRREPRKFKSVQVQTAKERHYHQSSSSQLCRFLSNQTRYSESQIQHFLQLNQTDDARNARSLHECDEFQTSMCVGVRFMQLEGRPNQTFVRFLAFVIECTTRSRYDAEVCMR